MKVPVVRISCRGNRGRVEPRTVQRRARRILGELDLLAAELSVMLCDDAFIHELNRTYRSQDKPTDVLSFCMHEGEELGANSDLLGDVVISVETAARQASASGRKIIDEVSTLLIHGVLHLAGYNHDTPKERDAMFLLAKKLETKILK